MCCDCGLSPRLYTDDASSLPESALTCALLIVDLSLKQISSIVLEESDFVKTEVLVMAAKDSPVAANRAIRSGAGFFFCKPVETRNLEPLIGDILSDSKVARVGDHPGEAPDSIDQFGWLRGSSPPMRKLFRTLRKVAPTDSSILITGESGTGKELVAKTLHEFSHRAGKPFIAFNCAAVVESLAESELFGHEKGSFSGADRRHIGVFEKASGGTLFLDELTEMPLDMQAKLLRVLESRRVRRVGAREEILLDVRILVATNRDPVDAVNEGLLREDLFFRVAHMCLWVPPLRDRGHDIAGLAQHFLNTLNERHDTSLTFTPAALEKLSSLRWPGNVRQLKHEVERGYILSEANIGEELLTDPDGQLQTVETMHKTLEVPLGETLADSERRILQAHLELYSGDKKRTADALGISLKTLYNRLREYREDPELDAAGESKANQS